MLNRRFTLLRIAVIILVMVFVYRGWFNNQPLVGRDWQYKPPEQFLDYFSLPQAWDSMYGGFPAAYGVGTLTRFPIYWLGGLLARLGASFSAIERILWFYPYLLVSAVSMYYLSYVLFRQRTVSLYSALLYTVNPGIIERLYRAQPWLAMAYAIAPLCLAFFARGMKTSSVKYGALAGIVFSISVWYDVRISVITGAIIGIFLLSKILFGSGSSSLISTRMVRLVILLSSFLVVVLGLNAFWLLPTILSNRASLYPAAFDDPQNLIVVGQFSGTLSQAFALFPKSWSDIVIYPINFLVPLLAFSVLLYRKKGSSVLCWGSLSLLLVFLAKGTYPPFATLYLWSLQHVPLFMMFRTSSKFLMMAALPYSLLFGLGAAELERLGDLAVPASAFRGRMLAKTTVFVLVCLVVVASNLYLLVGYTKSFNPTDFQLWKGEGSIFAPQDIPKSYLEIWQIILQQQPGFKSMLLPNYYSWRIGSQKHPIVYKEVYSQYPDFGLFAQSLLEHRVSGYAKVLGLASVKNIVLKSGGEVDWRYSRGIQFAEFRHLLDSQSGLARSYDHDAFLYENQYAVPLFYLTSKQMLIVGGRDALRVLAQTDLNLCNWATHFAEQLTGDRLPALSNYDVFVFDRTGLKDLTLLAADRSFHYYLWSYVPSYNVEEAPTRGIWKDYNYTRNVIKQGEIPLGQGLVYADNGEVTLPFVSPSEARYQFWLRASSIDSTSEQDVAVRLILDGVEISQVHVQGLAEGNLDWILLGHAHVTSGQHQVSLMVEGRLLMDDLAILPDDVYDVLVEQVDTELVGKNLILAYGISDMNSFEVPFEGEYSIAFFLPAELDVTRLDLYLDDVLQAIDEVSTSSTGEHLWIQTVETTLESGTHSLVLYDTDRRRPIQTEFTILREAHQLPIIQDGASYTCNENVIWERESSTRYRVAFSVNEPGFLIFTESYNPSWVAIVNEVDDEEGMGHACHTIVQPLVTTSAVNGFPIDCVGSLVLTVSFEPQKYVLVGLMISGLVLTATIAYLAIDHSLVRRRRELCS